MYGDQAFFAAALANLEEAAKQAGVLLTHFFFHGDVNRAYGDKPPGGFEFLQELLPGAVFVSSMRAELDFHSLCAADVLVGSGSSFAHTAATVAPARLIYLEHPPKEYYYLEVRAANNTIDVSFWATYHLNTSLTIEYNGSMSKPHLAQLVARLKSQQGVDELEKQLRHVSSTE